MRIFDLVVYDDDYCTDNDGVAYDCVDMHCDSSFELADYDGVLKLFNKNFNSIHLCTLNIDSIM